MRPVLFLRLVSRLPVTPVEFRWDVGAFDIYTALRCQWRHYVDSSVSILLIQYQLRLYRTIFADLAVYSADNALDQLTILQLQLQAIFPW